jgi:NadR type nicotinamide-nucleotide adenylyltransferase
MIRIAITGPESTGKSWLAERLAVHYHTAWVPEYARKLLEYTGGGYDFDDILVIANGQLQSEQEVEKHARELLFCDTEFLVTWIWCEFKYGKVHPWIVEKAYHHTYDLYLLCDIDLPWMADPLREHPAYRKELFNIYLDKLESISANYKIISGSGATRLNNAIAVVNEYVHAQP